VSRKFPVQVHLKLPRDLHAAVEQRALANFDTMQAWIRRTLAEAVAKPKHDERHAVESKDSTAA
jgi:hypothetical protein